MLKQVMSLLLSLFYSKKESELVAHQAMMSSDSVTLINGSSITDWGQVATGIAAFDGYLFLRATNNVDETASLNLRNSISYASLLYPFSSAGGSAVLPIAKGDMWSVEGSSSKNIMLELKKTIGSIGGGLSFIQGGAICLNNLLRSLLRSSLPTRKSGYQLAQQLKANRLMLSLSPTRTLTHIKTTRLQPTDTSLFEVVRTRLILMCQQVRELLTTAWVCGKDFPLVWLREILLVFGFTEVCRLLRLSSIQTKGINLHTGGAL